MAQMDGVKISAALKKKIAKHARAKTSPTVRRRTTSVSDTARDMSVRDRQKLVWIGVGSVMAAVVGVWIWLLPTTLGVIAKRVDTNDWNKLQSGLSETLERLENNSPEDQQIQQLQKAIFNDNANTSTSTTVTNSTPTNVNVSASEVQSNTNNAFPDIENSNALPE